MGQFASQADALLAPRAHDPEQFSEQPVSAQGALPGQVHDPACPRANPNPAISRTIEAIASFFILHHSTHLFERRTFMALMITIAYDDWDLGKIHGIIQSYSGAN